MKTLDSPVFLPASAYTCTAVDIQMPILLPPLPLPSSSHEHATTTTTADAGENSTAPPPICRTLFLPPLATRTLRDEEPRKNTSTGAVINIEDPSRKKKILEKREIIKREERERRKKKKKGRRPTQRVENRRQTLSD